MPAERWAVLRGADPTTYERDAIESAASICERARTKKRAVSGPHCCCKMEVPDCACGWPNACGKRQGRRSFAARCCSSDARGRTRLEAGKIPCRLVNVRRHHVARGQRRIAQGTHQGVEVRVSRRRRIQGCGCSTHAREAAGKRKAAPLRPSRAIHWPPPGRWCNRSTGRRSGWCRASYSASPL